MWFFFINSIWFGVSFKFSVVFLWKCHLCNSKNECEPNEMHEIPHSIKLHGMRNHQKCRWLFHNFGNRQFCPFKQFGQSFASDSRALIKMQLLRPCYSLATTHKSESMTFLIHTFELSQLKPIFFSCFPRNSIFFYLDSMPSEFLGKRTNLLSQMQWV